MSIPLGLLLSLLLGLAFGSFFNVVLLRVPQGKSLQGRSKCPKCGNLLRFWHLFPVVSWLCLGGKCAFCKTQIHWRYPVIEAVTGVLFALSFFMATQEASLFDPVTCLIILKSLLVVSLALLVFITDLEDFLIYDAVVFVFTILLLLVSGILDIYSWTGARNSQILSGLLQALLLSGLFLGIWKWSSGRWLGFGDVKFMVPFGLALGFPFGFLGVAIASILGTMVGVIMLIFLKAKMTTQLPFGVFLTLGLVSVHFWGNTMWTSYLTFTGELLVKWYN